MLVYQRAHLSNTVFHTQTHTHTSFPHSSFTRNALAHLAFTYTSCTQPVLQYLRCLFLPSPYRFNKKLTFGAIRSFNSQLIFS